MTHFAVESVDDRRVNEHDGTLQYRVRWKCSSPPLYRTWEPRAALSALGADTLQAVDQAAMEQVDKDVSLWRAQRGWSIGSRQAKQPNVADAQDGVRDNRDAVERCSDCPPRKRARSPQSATADSTEPAATDVEVLSALVWQCPVSDGHVTDARDATDEMGQGVAVLLGEVILSDSVVEALGHSVAASGAGSISGGGSGGHKRRRPQSRAPAPSPAPPPQSSPLCAASLALDRQWHAQFTHDLVRSVAASRCITPLCPHASLCPPVRCVGQRNRHRSSAPPPFQLTSPTPSRARRIEAERGSAAVTIVGIVPAQESRGGRVFAEPISFVPWLGVDASQELRRSATADAPQLANAINDVVGAHTEQLLVRYRCPEALAAVGARSVSQAGSGSEPEVVTSMPLSVFRVAFPQLLIDYLLAHTVVMHGTPKPPEQARGDDTR